MPNYSVMGPLWAFKRAPAGEKRGAVFFPLLIVELARVEISLLLEGDPPLVTIP